MTGRLGVLAALLVGGLAGAVATTALAPVPSVPDEVPVRPAVVRAAPVPAPASGVLLAWSPGGLPGGFVERLAADGALSPMTTVLGDTVELAAVRDPHGHAVERLAPGFSIPLEAVAVDCATWAPLVPLAEADAVCGLGPGDALVGATWARRRGLAAGTTLTLTGGRSLRVAGVVADEAIGAAELALPASGAAAAGVRTPRYVLGGYQGDRAAAEARIRAAAPGVGLRVRGPGETPWLRHGDAVLPQSIVKEAFGEFSARHRRDGTLELDRAWVAANLETVTLPVLGRVTCHRALVPTLKRALAEIEARHLLGPLDRRASGCWNARLVAGTNQPSRHAWGTAIDLVPFDGDPRVVEVLERFGFTWGGRWIDADPVHFEYVRPPKA